jgi:acyl dehydratase
MLLFPEDPLPKFYDDFEVGEKLVTPGRTLTETDMVNFNGLSGDFNSIHTDEEFAKTTPFGTRVAHGLMGPVLTSGLLARTGIFDGSILALLSVTWNFKKAIIPGDTLHVVQTVTSMRKTSSGDRGIIEFAIDLVNQRDEVTQSGTRTLMIATAH